MNMTSGKPYWPSTPDLRHGTYPELAGKEHCEAVVVGGGMTGALCAYELTMQGIDTVLIEKQGMAEASTSANAGLLQVSGDRTLSSLIESMGKHAGVSVYRRCRQALDRLEAICGELHDDVGFVRRRSLCFASSASDVLTLRREGETLRMNGFDVNVLEAEDISRAYPFRKELALLMSGDAEVNPLRLVHSLAGRASERGLRIYERTEALRIESGDDGVTVHTGGGVIRAARAVLAPGYEAESWQPNRGARLLETYAIATEPVDISIWPERCLIWEMARPYLYLRTTPDGRAIIGGFDEPFRNTLERDARLESRKAQLLQALDGLFPPYAGVRAEYAWCGTFVKTSDGLPLFGERPELPRCLFTLGYGGNGTVYSMLAASHIPSWIRTGSVNELEPFGLERMNDEKMGAGR